MKGADKIKNWMEKFKVAWLTKDIDAVFGLLSDDVEYWETPFQKMGKGDELRTAWEEVLSLENMTLEYEVFAIDSEKDRYGIKWKFIHTTGESAGVYLIELNEEGFCKYFYRSAQPRG